MGWTRIRRLWVLPVLAAAMVSAWMLAVAAPARAAGSITGLQVAATTQVAGATHITDKVTFTIPDAISASGSIELEAPAGSTFPSSVDDYSVVGTSSSSGVTGVTVSPGGGGANVVSIALRDALVPQTVTVTVVSVDDPGAADSGATFSALTSADPTAVNVSFPIGAPTGVSALSASEASASAGATSTVTVSYTPGAAVTKGGYIELTAPAGSSFTSTDADDYDISVNGNVYFVNEVEIGPRGEGDNVVDIYPDAPDTTAGHAVAVRASDLINPAAADATATMTVSTSSDTDPQSTAFPIGPPTAITGLTLNPGVAAAGAQQIHETIDFSAATAMDNCLETQPYCGYLGYGTVNLTAPVGTQLQVGTLTVVVTDVTTDNSAPAAVLESYSGNVSHFNVPFPTAAGDHLQIDVYRTINPGDPVSDGQFTVSTSVDTTAVSVDDPIGPKTAPSHVSTSVSFGSGDSATITSKLTATNELEGCPATGLQSDCTAYNTSFSGGAPQGFVQLSAPAGATFPSDVHDYTLSDSGASTTQLAYVLVNPHQAGDNVVWIYATAPVAAGAALTVSASAVSGVPQDPAIAVTTSSDVLTATVDAGQPPTSVTATPGNASAVVSWTPPAVPSGATRTGFRVITYDAAGTQQASSDVENPQATQLSVSPLTNGSAYTFRVAALYTIDGTPTTGPLSAASQPVTPMASGGPPAVSFSGAVEFGTATVGEPAAGQTLQVTNSGGENLTIGSVALSGENAGDFSVTQDSCSQTVLVSGHTCSIKLGFTPSDAGDRTATLTLSDDAAPGAQSETLHGTGDSHASLSGTVTDATGNPATPVAGATVSVCPVDATAGCVDAMTDGQGDYSATGLDAGTYTVHVQPAARRLLDASATVPVAAGRAVTQDFALSARPLGSVTGTITLDGTGGKSPAAGATVQLCAGSTGSTACQTTSADAAGGYGFTELDPGSYLLVVSSGTERASQPVVVTAFQTTTQDILIQLPASGIVMGAVTTQAGGPVAGATVRVCDATNDNCQSTTTGSDGLYLLASVNPGKTLVQVQSPSVRYFDASATINVPVGKVVQNFVLAVPELFSAAGIGETGSVGVFDGVPAFYFDAPFQLTQSPNFPSEPEGTELVYVATISLTSLGQLGGSSITAGSGVFHVVYGAGDTPTVTDQYADPDSGPAPKLSYGSGASPKVSSSFGVAGIVVQYDPVSHDIVSNVPSVDRSVHGAFHVAVTRSYAVVVSAAHAARARPATAGRPVTAYAVRTAVSAKPPKKPKPKKPTKPKKPGKPKPGRGPGKPGGGGGSGGKPGKGNGGNPTTPGPCRLTISAKGKTIFVKLSPTGGSGGGTGKNPCGSPSSPTQPNPTPTTPTPTTPTPTTPTPTTPTPTSPTPTSPTPLTGPVPTSPLPNTGGDAYFDPSGTVRTTTGIPLQNATVTLLEASTSMGPFTAVPNGSVVMSLTNRRNPDHTSGLGAFGWDTLAGFYRVQATHPGCSSTTSQTYAVPPPVSGIVLALKCPHVRRHAARLSLTLRHVRGDTWLVTARVHSRKALGTVRFTAHRLSVAVALAPETGSAQFVLPQGARRVTARYGGDANAKPVTTTVSVPR